MFSFLLLLISLPSVAATNGVSWAVASATHRFEVEIVDPPSDLEAGNIALLPDGGALPKPGPDVTVTDADGKDLKCGIVWHNPREGAGICFDTPLKGRNAFIYLQSTPKVKPLDSKLTGLKPGVLMFIETATAPPSLSKVMTMPRDVPPGRSSRLALVPNIGQMENRLGQDDNYMSWYTGWIKIEKPGRYFFATISDEGSEFRLDGKLVARWSGQHTRAEGAKGQFGDSVDLSKGIYPIEYLHFEVDRQQEAHLCWKAAGTLSDKLPVTVPEDAFLHSGVTRIVNAQMRDGSPIPVMDWQCVKYAWVGEKPLNLFRLSAVPKAPASKDVRTTWKIDETYELEDREFVWFWEDEAEHAVTLSVGRGATLASSTLAIHVPVYPPRASLDVAADRDLVRKAFISRLKAGPAQRRPCSDWSSNLWATLTAVLDPYEAPEIPQLIVERSRQDLARVSAEWRWVIEDLFIENQRIKDPAGALPWVQRFATEEMETSRKVHWQMERARILINDLGRTDEARAALGEIQPMTLTPEAAVRATVLAGDVERFAGKREEAARHYAAAQDRYRAMQKSAAALSATRRESADDMSAMARLAGDWRIAAVREGANHATVQSLVDQSAWGDARRALDQWEIEFPLSKLEGDFPLAEAGFYMGIKDHRRAQRILAAYRTMVEMNSYLARAISMEMRCLEALGLKAEMEALTKEAAKRIPTGTAVVPARKR